LFVNSKKIEFLIPYGGLFCCNLFGGIFGKKAQKRGKSIKKVLGEK